MADLRPGGGPTTVRSAALAVLLVTACAVTGCSAPSASVSAAHRSHPADGRTAASSVPSAADAASRVTPARSSSRPPVSHLLATRCPGTSADQLVVVSLAAQHAWLCHRGRTVRSYPITSGRATAGTRTPTGTFRIQGRNRNSVLTLSNGRQYDVKYWIPFDAPDFGFHDAAWQRIPFGSPQYRTHGSHGCVHMARAAVAFLYRWVEIGAKVRITAS